MDGRKPPSRSGAAPPVAHAGPIARGKRGLTQAVLTARAGISRPYLAQLESGDRMGGLATSRALCVRIEYLLPD